MDRTYSVQVPGNDIQRDYDIVAVEFQSLYFHFLLLRYLSGDQGIRCIIQQIATSRGPSSPL
jgi:hypothetical protein